MIQVRYKPIQEAEIVEIIIGDALDVVESENLTDNGNDFNYNGFQDYNRASETETYKNSLDALYPVAISADEPIAEEVIQ